MLSPAPGANIGAMASVVERRVDFDLARRSTNRVVAGVAGGVADRLGVAAGYVRAAFVVASALWGLGIVLYVALWLATFERVEDVTPSPLKTRQRVGLVLVLGGGLLIFRSLGWWPGDPMMLIVVTLAFGVASLSDFDWLARVFDPAGSRPSRLRAVAGAILLLVGLFVLARSVSQVRTLGAVATAVIITVVGVTLVFGPWLFSLVRELGSERRERIRQEERAEMAAHLHDSVLQTLALMQRTDDSKRMVTLARQQERELRSWLYGDPGRGEDDLKSALQAAAARVEGDFSLPVEVVTVGEVPASDPVRALVAAATEAIVNAAKHSGAPEVSVYAEVAGNRVDVWVADMGVGFDVSAVPNDRHGLSESIHARLHRAGGAAEVDSIPDEGTEVHLWVPLENGTSHS